MWEIRVERYYGVDMAWCGQCHEHIRAELGFGILFYVYVCLFIVLSFTISDKTDLVYTQGIIKCILDDINEMLGIPSTHKDYKVDNVDSTKSPWYTSTVCLCCMWCVCGVWCVLFINIHIFIGWTSETLA
jgi:hypothetical protein